MKPGFINIKFKPIFWTNFIKEIIQNSKSFVVNNNENKKNYLRQDLEKFYLPNGAIYFSKITTFKGSFYGNKTMFYEMDIKSSIDIDNFSWIRLAGAVPGQFSSRFVTCRGQFRPH